MDLITIPGVNNHPGTFTTMRNHMPERHRLHCVVCDPLTDVDAIAARILESAPPRFAVLGHSFGGHVALAIAAAYPERVAGIALVNSADWADSDLLMQLREERARQAEDGGYPALADAASQRAYHPDNAGRADLLEERRMAVQAYGAARFAAHQRAMAARPDRREMLKQRKFPLLVVVGDADVVVPTDRQLQMAKDTGASQVTIASAGHMLPVEQPAALAAAISNWLDMIDAEQHRSPQP